MNLSFLTSDFWSVLIALEVFNATLYWLYFIAFAVIIVGLVVYYVPLQYLTFNFFHDPLIENDLQPSDRLHEPVRCLLLIRTSHSLFSYLPRRLLNSFHHDVCVISFMSSLYHSHVQLDMLIIYLRPVSHQVLLSKVGHTE